jgi:hypothetical protein
MSVLPKWVFTRQQILQAACRVDPSFKETQLRALIGTLLRDHLIMREGHNQYRVVGEGPQKPHFVGVYSPAALHVIAYMNDRFPLLSFRVWELSWLNEFFNHLIARNQIYLEVERVGVEYVFSSLFEILPGKVLYRPTEQDVAHYSAHDSIIVDRLITEAPKSQEGPHQVPLEKLIIDMFANKNLLLFEGEFPATFEMMFSKYHLDQVAMLRYARRRNKEKVLREFFKSNTEIEL